MKKETFIENGLPKSPGVYLARGIYEENKEAEIEVYNHRKNGLCCLYHDFIRSSAKVHEKYGSHIPVRETNLEFIRRVRDIIDHPIKLKSRKEHDAKPR